MTRIAYVHDLQELRDDVVAMASMTDKAIARSIDALRRQDVLLAREVMNADRYINNHRWQTEERALRLIATQAPMAGDLRTISSAIHITTDLERMADHAAGIAKIVIQIADEPVLKPLVDIPRMSELAREMLSGSVTAYIDGNVEDARTIALRDDEVDALYDQIYRELLTYMMADPGTINRATRLLWAAHNIERIADRVTNICEWVIFAVNGSLEELARSVNPSPATAP
ncbi:MAG: phosphate signaling complex protein PhoU [Chloroflexota bacterium]|jgi:phosphate transport system protein|nr:phosphate signaling complex protein PhoU [Chloroflexota bacterium]